MSLLFILDMVGTVAFAAAAWVGACKEMDLFLASEVPLILRQKIYASAGILGGILLVVLTRLESPEQLNLLLVAGGVILVRVLAIRYNWSLPKPRTQ